MPVRFHINADNTMTKNVNINGTKYKIVIPREKWQRSKTTKHVEYWIRRKKEGKSPTLKYGNVFIIDGDIENTSSDHICDVCGLSYRSRSGLLKHISNKHSIHPSIDATSHVSNDDIENVHSNTPTAPYELENPFLEPTIQTGYIYCFSNPAMPGIYKIGMTLRTVEDRLRESNQSDTWRPPSLYKIVCYKCVNHPSKCE